MNTLLFFMRILRRDWTKNCMGSNKNILTLSQIGEHADERILMDWDKWVVLIYVNACN